MVYKLIPKPTDSPANDSQADILENFTELDLQYGTAGDHVEFTAVAANGKHKQATLIDLGADPVTGATEGTVYTKTVGARIEPFYRYPSSGDIFQLSWIKAWVRFVGGGVAGAKVINDSYNVSGVNLAASIYTISFATPLGNNNYGTIITGDGTGIVRVISGSPQLGSVGIFGGGAISLTVVIVGS